MRLLTLERQGFELRGSALTWIFSVVNPTLPHSVRSSVGNTATPHGIKDVEEPLSTYKEARLQVMLGFRLWIVLFGVDHIKIPAFPKVVGAGHPLPFSGELE